MKNFFPPQNQGYLQTNRSNKLGSLWSSFNLDLQSNLGKLRLANKLVINTNSTDDTDLGKPVAFRYALGVWWAICGTKMFKTADELPTSDFIEDTTAAFSIGLPSTQFDVTNPAGTTFRYTYDFTGTDPNITATSIPIGATVVVFLTNMASGNEGTFTVTGSGANYFEVTNASGVIESNKTIGASGYISVLGGTQGALSAEISDMETFDDRLWISNTNGIYSRDSLTEPWILRVSNPGGSFLRKLVYFQKFNRLYFRYGTSSVGSIDEDNVAVTSAGFYFLDLGNSIGQVYTMTATSDSIWIGTRASLASNNAGLKGTINQWDGVTSATIEYSLGAVACVALTVSGNVAYAIDSNGLVKKHTGYSFAEIARLPIDKTLLKDATSAVGTNGRFVHANGFISTRDNTLLVLVNNLLENLTGSVPENLPSGIWELDLNTNNFIHKHSFVLKKNSSSIVLDYGQNRIVSGGAIYLNTTANNSSAGRITLLAGASYYTDLETTASAIFMDSPANPSTEKEGQKRGYFVTTFFNSLLIKERWEDIWTTYRRFLASTDKMTFKYRLIEENPLEVNIIWVTTSSFTTLSDVSAYAPTATGFDGTYGGEVEITQAAGSGACVHVLSITGSSPYTVTLDNAIPNVSGTGKARFQKWKKLLPEVTGQVQQYAQIPLGQEDTQIQIKAVFEFTGDNEFNKMILLSNDILNIE
jgi:hypothetical protein